MMRLFGNVVLLEPLPKKTVSPEGILFAERYLDDQKQWRVLMVGPGRKTKRGVLIKPELEVGDCILTEMIHGNKFAYENGSGWIIIEADEIIAKWQDEQSIYYQKVADSFRPIEGRT